MPTRTLFIACCTALCAFALRSACADDALDPIRNEFRGAYTAVDAQSSVQDVVAAAKSDSDALRQYALYPYLQLTRLERELAVASDFAAVDSDAAAFVALHVKDSVGNELRRSWYPSLAKRQQWDRLLTDYRDVNDPAIHCDWLAARVALKRVDHLQEDILTTWLNTAQSQQECATAFDWLRAQHALSDQRVEWRARLALNTGNTAFARQLIAMLPDNLAAPLLAWADLIDKPRQAIDAAIADPHKPIEPAALLDGWTRLARGDMDAAMHRYKHLVRARKFPPALASRYALELALALAWSRRHEALHYFSLVRRQEFDERGYEWHARAALWAHKWHLAAKTIAAMPDSLRSQTKWQYWSARCEQLLGRTDIAHKHYAKLIDDDNYYAALAAARLKTPYRPRPQPLSIDTAQIEAIAAKAPFVRARELLLIRIPALRGYAYDEWRHGYGALNAGERLQSIALAARWRWYDQAILTAAQQNFFDDYELLYPRPFDAEVEAAANGVRLPATLVYATVRQESLYRVDAQSAAGAVGLMQMLGETAHRTARRFPDIANMLPKPIDLTDPFTNIALGAAHLRDLVNRNEDNVAVALAAYNAGAGAARRWLPDSRMDTDVWIENIPYNETRVYVQRILWHSVVFGWLESNRAQNTTSWLTHVGPEE